MCSVAIMRSVYAYIILNWNSKAINNALSQALVVIIIWQWYYNNSKKKSSCSLPIKIKILLHYGGTLHYGIKSDCKLLMPLHRNFYVICHGLCRDMSRHKHISVSQHFVKESYQALLKIGLNISNILLTVVLTTIIFS